MIVEVLKAGGITMAVAILTINEHKDVRFRAPDPMNDVHSLVWFWWYENACASVCGRGYFLS